MKPKGLAELHQALCSLVGSGDETRKHIDLDHLEHFHLIVRKLFPLPPPLMMYDTFYDTHWLSCHTQIILAN